MTFGFRTGSGGLFHAVRPALANAWGGRTCSISAMHRIAGSRRRNADEFGWKTGTHTVYNRPDSVAFAAVHIPACYSYFFTACACFYVVNGRLSLLISTDTPNNLKMSISLFLIASTFFVVSEHPVEIRYKWSLDYDGLSVCAAKSVSRSFLILSELRRHDRALLC